jgi:hypothetical protein
MPLAFRLVLSTFALREPALAQYFLLTGLDVMDALAMIATARLHFAIVGSVSRHGGDPKT